MSQKRCKMDGPDDRHGIWPTYPLCKVPLSISWISALVIRQKDMSDNGCMYGMWHHKYVILILFTTGMKQFHFYIFKQIISFINTWFAFNRHLWIKLSWKGWQGLCAMILQFGCIPSTEAKFSKWAVRVQDQAMTPFLCSPNSSPDFLLYLLSYQNKGKKSLNVNYISVQVFPNSYILLWFSAMSKFWLFA